MYAHTKIFYYIYIHILQYRRKKCVHACICICVWILFPAWGSPEAQRSCKTLCGSGGPRISRKSETLTAQSGKWPGDEHSPTPKGAGSVAQTKTYAQKNTYMYTYTRTKVTIVPVYTYICIHTPACVYVHVHVCVTYAGPCTCIYIYIYIHIYICMYIPYTCMYACTYVCMYVCMYNYMKGISEAGVGLAGRLYYVHNNAAEHHGSCW